jgi:phytoene/squalene synthetase
MARFGVTDDQLFAHEWTPALKALMAFQVHRTEQMFHSGRSLCDTVPHPRLRWQLRLTWLGGMRILEKIQANDYRVFERPTLGVLDWFGLAWRSARWRGRRSNLQQIGPS